MEFRHTHLLIISTVICIVSSDTKKNSELLDTINKMELSVFGENPCQNCTVEL